MWDAETNVDSAPQQVRSEHRDREDSTAKVAKLWKEAGGTVCEGRVCGKVSLHVNLTT